MESRERSWGAVLGVLAVVVFWGLNYPFVNLGLTAASPLWLAALRAGVGALATLAVVTALHGWGTLDRRGQRDALLLGLVNTGAFFGLWFWAARSVAPGLAAVVIYTFPLWVALLSMPVLSYALNRRQWLSVALGFLGVALISELGESGHTGLSLPTAAALLLAAICWALGTVLFQRRFRATELMAANGYQLVGGTLGLLAAAIVVAPTPLPSLGPALVASVLWMGILGTAVAYVIWFTLLGRTPAAALSAFTFLVPVVALAFSATFLGERLDSLQLVGVALVLASIYGISRGYAQRSPASPPPADVA